MITDEESKAIQEVAKAAKKYQPSVDSFGAFIGKIVGYPLQQTGGLIGDAFGLARIEIALRFQKRVDRIMEERGIKTPQRTIPISVAYPLLQAATLEEDEELSEMFANLLVNSIDASFSDYVPKSFVETIKSMSPFEAKVINAMFDAPADALDEIGFMYTATLPDAFLKVPEAKDEVAELELSRELGLAMASLKKAGLIETQATWGGHSVFKTARVSDYGKELIKACRP